MTLKKNTLLLLLLACIFACGEAEETTEPEEPVVIKYGAISGHITDVGTGNRIPGSTVKLLEQLIETGVDGAYAFQGVPYGCLLYTSPSPRDRTRSRMPSSA